MEPSFLTTISTQTVWFAFASVQRMNSAALKSLVSGFVDIIYYPQCHAEANRTDLVRYFRSQTVSVSVKTQADLVQLYNHNKIIMCTLNP